MTPKYATYQLGKIEVPSLDPNWNAMGSDLGERPFSNPHKGKITRSSTESDQLCSSISSNRAKRKPHFLFINVKRVPRKFHQAWLRLLRGTNDITGHISVPMFFRYKNKAAGVQDLMVSLDEIVQRWQSIPFIIENRIRRSRPKEERRKETRHTWGHPVAILSPWKTRHETNA